MKKVFITVLMTGLAMHLHAQIPEKKSVALIDKLTATWCPPCGGWGWLTAEQLITETKGKALFMSLYVGANDNNNGLLKNPTSETLAPNFTTTSGLPNFGVNGVGRTSDYITDKNTDIAGLKAECLRVVDEFSTATPLASPACIMSIDGNTITVKAKVQFWSAAQDDYYLAAYIIEDSVVNMQRTPDSLSTQAMHRKVLRGSMSGRPFGDLIASGTINTGQCYDKEFRFTITDPQWNKHRLQVYTVLWRKEYNDYRYVNAASPQEAHQATRINSVAGVQELYLFPNPAYGTATLSLSLPESQTIRICMMDMAGQPVYQESYKAGTGSNAITLPLEGIGTGVYNVSIEIKNGSIAKRLTVLR